MLYFSSLYDRHKNEVAKSGPLTGAGRVQEAAGVFFYTLLKFPLLLIKVFSDSQKFFIDSNRYPLRYR